MTQRKSILVGALYFILFSVLFFGFTYWISQGRTRWQSGGKIALIRIEGVIFDSREIIRELRRYERDPEIKAILVRIDSPGGAVAPSQEIYDELKKIQSRGQKKVVSSMGSVAASGGYYIASASEVIIANPGTLTGSIGVIMELTNVEGLLQKIGVESVTIKSGKNKDVGSPFRKMSEEERALLQDVLDDVHNQFIEAVAEGRSLEIETVRLLADGRIFSGRQAMAAGLVDQLGSLEVAIEKAAELVGIEGEPHIVETKEKSPFMKFLEGKLFGDWERSRFQAGPIGLHYLFSF